MSFLQALNVQGRVISALTLRETRSRYGNKKLGFFWALFEPFAHIAVFIGIFSALGRSSPLGDNIGIFILTGIVPWLLFNNIVSSVMNGTQANKALMGYPQVMPLDIAISRITLDIATLLLVFIFFLGVAIAMDIHIEIDNFLQMVQPIGLLVLFATGVGLINAAITYYYPSYANIYSALSRPLYFMSGVFFTADFLSPEVYKYLYYNPLLHIMEWTRSGFYTSFNSHLYDPKYVITVSLCIFALGLVADRLTMKKSRQQ